MIPGAAWQPCASEARRPSCPRTPGGGEALSVEERLSILGARCANGYANGWRKSSLDEPGGWITANKVSGVGQEEYGGLPRGQGAQPGPDGEATGQRASGDSSHPGWVTSPWRSASGNPRMGQTRTIIGANHPAQQTSLRCLTKNGVQIGIDTSGYGL